MLSRGVIALLFILVSVSNVLAQTEARKPNILFIFADDQSFNTIHALGNDEIETPHLDSLVNRGTTFTRAYNMGGWNGAICIASRTMLLTGRFLGQAEQVDKQLDKDYREANKLWPQRLASVGYETYFSGKWHIKAKADKAFTVCRHVRPGMPNQTPAGYNRPVEGEEDKWSPYDKSFDGFWKDGQHWSEVLGDDGVDYLKMAGESDKPFFIYLAFNAPHDPRQSPKEFVDRYPLDGISVPQSFLPLYPYKDDIGCSAKLRDEKLAPFPRTEYSVKVNRQEYYAIITHMDQQIGRLLKALEDTGKADNTWIFFTADHGLSVGHHGLIGKQNMYDHSVRVPFMVVGPGVAAGAKNSNRIYLQDGMATTLDLAGVEKPDDVQFKSLLPMLKGSTQPQYDSIFNAYTKVQRAITFGDYKLIVYPTIKKLRLFDLATDPLEMNDLAELPESNDIVKACFQKMLSWQEIAADTLDIKSLFPKLL